MTAVPARLRATLREGMERATQLLEPRSVGIYCRRPMVDDTLPEVSDVDLLSIWGSPEEYPERLVVAVPSGRVFVDVLWVPAKALLDPTGAAGYELLPHLLLESREVLMKSAATREMVGRIKLNVHRKNIWEHRMTSQIESGDAALQEAPRNLDFPPACLFYLQTAHSYYVMALADCLRQSITGLLTRPVAKLRRMAVLKGPGLEESFVANLHLDVEPTASFAALRRLHDVISAACAGKRISEVSAKTRGHYLYSISPLELEYREAVARALVDRGDRAGANFYLRFWAYCIARCPIVLEEAHNGRKPSFYVPFRPLKESLMRTCPMAIDEFSLILGGDMTKDETMESVRATAAFRETVMVEIRRRGLRPSIGVGPKYPDE